MSMYRLGEHRAPVGRLGGGRIRGCKSRPVAVLVVFSESEKVSTEAELLSSAEYRLRGASDLTTARFYVIIETTIRKE